MTSSMLVLGASLAPSTALPDHPGLLENLEFQAVGLVIVMGALLAMYLLCAGVGAFFQRVERARLAPRPAAQPAPAVASPEAAQATPTATAAAEVPVVVIAAAVAAAVGGKPHRVVSVAPTSAGWSLEGRRQLLISHQLRK